MNALLGRVLPRHRAMNTADLDAVLAIERAAYAFPWTQGNFIDSLAAGYWARLRTDPQGRPLAYALAMTVVDELHLLNLTVAPSCEGQGHARALLDDLQDHGRVQGLVSLWLEVRQSNERAQRLYLGRGFRQVGCRPAYYPAPAGQREDAVVMSLPLVARDGLD